MLYYINKLFSVGGRNHQVDRITSRIGRGILKITKGTADAQKWIKKSRFVELIKYDY
jgi:hypothetical protein